MKISKLTEKILKMLEEQKKDLKVSNFTKTNSENATHWLCLEDDESLNLTAYQPYRLFYDKYDNEDIIHNNNGKLVYPFCTVKGYFVRGE